MTTLATQQPQQGIIIRNAGQLKQHIMGIIEDPRYAAQFSGLLDRKAVFLAMMKIADNPALVRCKPDSIINALTQAGAFGWTCEPITGHAFLVPFGDNATLMPGYRGLMDLVHRAGEARIMGEAVFDGDQYEFRGPYDRPLHVPSNDVDRRKRPLTHVYAIATFKDRSVRCWEMTRQECIEHRNSYSKGYRGKESDLWHEKNPAFPAMCRKTVLIRAIKSGEIPISIEARGKRLEYITEDDVPKELCAVTFETPAGFDDHLHTETQTAYTVEPPDTLPICDRFHIALAKIASAGTPDDAIAFGDEYNSICDDLPEADREAAKNRGFEAVEKRCAQLTADKAKRGERANKQRTLPGE